MAKTAPEQTGQTFNVWYGKWAGGDKYDDVLATKSLSRVNIQLDSGYTRADGGNNAYSCMYFARGCCPYGVDCTWLHRLPPPQAELPDSSMDVFGRPKHSDYRDDMGGVGSFQRMNRTLYVGKIKESRNTAETIERHFEEFGDIERSQSFPSRFGFPANERAKSVSFRREASLSSRSSRSSTPNSPRRQ